MRGFNPGHPSRRRQSAAIRGLYGLSCLVLLVTTAIPAGVSGAQVSPASCLTFSCLHPWSANATLTVTNGQSSGTGTYQQNLTLNSSAYSGWLDANDSNLYIVYPNGTAVPTWFEANATPSSNHTILWLRLWNIPAHSSQTLYADFAPTSSFLWSVAGPVGASPLLTPTAAKWGGFDDGARVFNLYDNFSGASLSALWAQHGGWTLTTGSGAAVTRTTCSNCFISSTAAFAYPGAVDWYGNLFETPTIPQNRYAEGFGSSDAAANASFVGVGGGSTYQVCGEAGLGSSFSFGSSCTGSGYYASQTLATFSVGVSATAVAFVSVNYSLKDTISATMPSSPQPVLLAAGSFNGNFHKTERTDWIRERSFEGSQPSASLGPAVPATGAATGLALLWSNATALTVGWEAPASETNATVWVWAALSDLCAGQAYRLSSTSGPADAYTAQSLLPSHPYCVEVEAWNGSSPAALSAPLSVYTQATAQAQAPAAPTALSGLDLPNDGLVVLLDVAATFLVVWLFAPPRAESRERRYSKRL